MMQAHFVYYLHDAESGVLLYIGRSLDPERRRRAFKSRTGIETVLGLSQRFLVYKRAEEAELKAIKDHWPPYNKKLVSTSGMLGHPHRDSAKERSDEFREKMKRLNKGRVTSTETKQKLSQVAKGKPKSPETRERMKLAWILRKERK